MKSIKNFIKRNVPVLLLGFVILAVFVVIILFSPNTNNNIPAGFIKVEEDVFKDREPAEPTPEEKPAVYTPQIPSPENKGKPYFYGEYDPNLRDADGYPTSPGMDSVIIPQNLSQEDKDTLMGLALEKIGERSRPTKIAFTEAGFGPENAAGFTGREIIWTNNTAKDIKIVEAVPKHEALKNGITIRPGESFSFKPLINKMFTYFEVTSGKYGTVNVGDITTPLLDKDALGL